MTLTDLVQRDDITAAWFWTTSVYAGPYAENERFDGMYVRTTNMVVGGGYHERRTFYVQGVETAQVDSRRENGGDIVLPDTTAVLAHVIADAHEATQYASVRAWAEDCRNHHGDGRYSLDVIDDYATHMTRHAQLVTWLGDEYDEYVKAAQQYAAEH